MWWRMEGRKRMRRRLNQGSFIGRNGSSNKPLRNEHEYINNRSA